MKITIKSICTFLTILIIYLVASPLCNNISPIILNARNTHRIPVPTASGRNVNRSNRAEIDYSNIRRGYVMIRFTAQTEQSVRVLIRGPGDIQYQYILNTNGAWEVFPLSEGNGSYTIGVFEQINGNRFATLNNITVDVTLINEFAPFLTPNQFVNFNQSSRVVRLANELTAGSRSVFDSVSRIYEYVITNINYDFVLATTVRSGFVPNLDRVLDDRMGICFCFAALMTAMLRSQGIPTKLVIGYAGDVFHAWISVHSEETGWVTNVIWFDGASWNLMDPTFAANANESPEIMRFIGNGENYNPTHFH